MPGIFETFATAVVGRPVAVPVSRVDNVVPVSRVDNVTTFSDGSMAFAASPDTEPFAFGPDPRIASGQMNQPPQRINVHMELERPPRPSSYNSFGTVSDERTQRDYDREQTLIDRHIYFEGIGSFRCCPHCGDYKGRHYVCRNEHCPTYELPMTGGIYANTQTQNVSQAGSIGGMVNRASGGRDSAIEQFMSNQQLRSIDSLDSLATAGWTRADGSSWVQSTAGRATIEW